MGLYSFQLPVPTMRTGMLGSGLVELVALGTTDPLLSRVDLHGVRPHRGDVRWRRAGRSSWPTPEIAELMELSGQLRRALLATQGRHRPRLEDMALADRLAAHVLAERHGGRKQESREQHVAINALPAG